VIARVHYNAIVNDKKGEMEFPDYCDIHVANLSDAEEIFKFWIQKEFSIRGGKSQVWHLQGKYGRIEFVSVEKRPKKQPED